MFCVVIAALQENGKKIFCEEGNMDETTYCNMLKVFEMVLSYRAWLKKDTFWDCDDIKSLEDVQGSVSIFLDEIINDFPRTTGNEWGVPKMHEQKHGPKNIHF